MAKYGMPYQGSKNSIAEELINILPKGNRFVDLFGGGFAMSHCALLSNKYKNVYYNEINQLLPELIKKAINGDYNYNKFKPEFITRENFIDMKGKDGYIKYIWSFGNNGNTYLFGKKIEKQKESIHNWVVFNKKDKFFEELCPDIDNFINAKDIKQRRLELKKYFRKQKNERLDLQQLERLQQLQQLERLERLELNCGNYKDYKYIKGDVVYCDPPYESTGGYDKKDFNHKEFYDWVATREYPIYFSSYEINDNRFYCIYEIKKRSLMNGAKTIIYKIEKLYTNKKGYELINYYKQLKMF